MIRGIAIPKVTVLKPLHDLNGVKKQGWLVEQKKEAVPTNVTRSRTHVSVTMTIWPLWSSKFPPIGLQLSLRQASRLIGIVGIRSLPLFTAFRGKLPHSCRRDVQLDGLRSKLVSVLEYRCRYT